jgi:hypothetical protein
MPYVRPVRNGVGRHCGADLLLLAPAIAGYRAHRSAHADVELELLKAAAGQRLATGQGELDLGLDTGAPGGPLSINASRMGCLFDTLEQAYRGAFNQVSGR